MQYGGDIDEVCELVNDVELVLRVDDSFNAYLLKTVKNNNGAAVLLLSDVFGFEDSGTRDFAYHAMDIMSWCQTCIEDNLGARIGLEVNLKNGKGNIDHRELRVTSTYLQNGF